MIRAGKIAVGFNREVVDNEFSPSVTGNAQVDEVEDMSHLEIQKRDKHLFSTLTFMKSEGFFTENAWKTIADWLKDQGITNEDADSDTEDED